MNEMVDISLIKPYEGYDQIINPLNEGLVATTIGGVIIATIVAAVKHYIRLNTKCDLFVTDSKIGSTMLNHASLKKLDKCSSLCTMDELDDVIKRYCLKKAEYSTDKNGVNYIHVKDPNKEYYVYANLKSGNQLIHKFTLKDLEKDSKYKIKVEQIFLKDKKKTESTNEALEIIRARKALTEDTSINDQLTKSYGDTHLYSLVASDYNEQLMKFIRTSHEIDKRDESFKDIEYDVKRRQTSVAILKILQSDNVVLMISQNNLPLPRTFKVITATDIRAGEIKKKKVFIDATTIISNDNGVYKCNPRSIDILLAYLVDAATQYIYYADPKRIIMDRNMISEGAWCFSKLFTYVIDYLVKVSVNGNMKDQIMYISAVYYLKTIMKKDLSDSHFKICKDISGLSDREIELLNIKFENESYTNIKTFVHGIADLCVNDKITLDVIVNKWIYLYGQGTQFALELFPAFANMLTNAYNGQFLNNQPAIEKQCGSHMVNFSKGVLNIIEDAVK